MKAGSAGYPGQSKTQ